MIPIIIIFFFSRQNCIPGQKINVPDAIPDHAPYTMPILQRNARTRRQIFLPVVRGKFGRRKKVATVTAGVAEKTARGSDLFWRQWEAGASVPRRMSRAAVSLSTGRENMNPCALSQAA